jgi:antitoxin MazE
MSELLHVFLAPQKRGLIAFTPELRRRLRLDEPGAQLEVLEQPDGTFQIRGTAAVPADQAWFWVDRWQKMESEADADIAAGRVTVASSVDELLDQLDS